MIMGVDIETYSSVDLQKAGVRPYTEAPDFTILLISYRVDGQPTRIIDLADSEDVDPSLLPPVLSDLPAGDTDEFLCLLTSPEVVKTAYNASFERTCLARYFARPMPPEQWRCTMVQAATLGLPGTLAQVGAALGLEKQKLTEGAELIRYFCKPAKDGTRHYPKDAPDKWERFRKYNVRDVDVETDIRDRLARWPRPPAELAAWELDQRINDRGVRLDTGLLDKALELDGQYSARLMAEARQLTALGNPNSDAQLKGWLAGRGLVTDSLDKNAIPPLLEAAPDDTTRRVLQLRQELGKTSVKKYEAMERGRCQDGRVHNLLQFYGAGRTGRWAGRLVQVQNLPQNKLNDLSTARELVKNGEFDLLELAYGSPPFVLSQLIRTAFIPSEGCRFIIADYPYYEAGELAFKRFPADEVLPFWADADHTILDAAVHVYMVQEYDEAEQAKEVVKVEVMHGGGVDCFIRKDDGTLIPDDYARSGPYITETDEGSGEAKTYNWERIPLVCFKSSHHELPLLSRVKCLQDAYNDVLSNFANQMDEDVHSTILVIRNYDGEDLGRFRHNLATYGAIKVRSYENTEGGVDTLTLEVNAENFKTLLALLKDAIIENARGYDAKDERMSGNPNQMNIQSMYSDIDLDANGIETEFQAAFEELLWFVNKHLANTGKGSFEGTEVKIIFDRDVLINETEAINNCKASVGILSNETIVKMHPWVTDPEEELKRLKEEKEKEAAADPYRAAFEATRGTGGAPGKGAPPPVKDGEGDGKEK